MMYAAKKPLNSNLKHLLTTQKSHPTSSMIGHPYEARVPIGKLGRGKIPGSAESGGGAGGSKDGCLVKEIKGFERVEELLSIL